MDLKMRQQFLLKQMIEGYFMGMTSARFSLASLNMTIDDAKMVCLC